MLRSGDSIIRDTSESSWLLTILIVTASLAVWLWSLVNLPSIKDIAIVYLFMSIDAMILGGFAYISNNIFPFAVLGVPKLKEAVLPVLVGVSYGLIFINSFSFICTIIFCCYTIPRVSSCIAIFNLRDICAPIRRPAVSINNVTYDS